MANQEHFDILKQGVKVWNQWREKHPDLIPDLEGADLEEAKQRHASMAHIPTSCSNYGQTPSMPKAFLLSGAVVIVMAPNTFMSTGCTHSYRP